MVSLALKEKLWATADKPRSNMDASEYKHVVLGLIFLKYISDAFDEVAQELVERLGGLDVDELPDAFHDLAAGAGHRRGEDVRHLDEAR